MMLLDTHLLLFLVNGNPIRFAEEYATASLAVSPISAGEIACLQRLGRIRLSEPADRWFDSAVGNLGAHVVPLTSGLFARAMLSDWAHGDPADRILVQCVRDVPGLELHTRDARILRYGAEHGLKMRDCRM